MWWIAFSLAYEVDAWTPRQSALADAREAANRQFDALMATVESRTPCGGSEAVLKRRLAKNIRRLTAKRVQIPGRPGLARFGHGTYSGWLETHSDVPRVHTGNGGIFAGVRLSDGFILRTAGTASTVRIGEVWIGTDKIDHFLATGHSYWRWSRRGSDPDRAIRRGERTERTMLGRWTSGAFSHADLAANWDGYRFYDSLLLPGSPFERSSEGCAVKAGAWDWSSWVAPDWDELVNPSVYGRRIQRRIAERLEEDREAVCAVEPIRTTRIPTTGRIPVARGPLGLAGFCDVDPVTPFASAVSSSPGGLP